jgi:O-methyltransferase
MMSGLLRKKASGLLKKIYRLTQSVSRNAVDSHIENYIIDDFISNDYGGAHGVTRQVRAQFVKQAESVVANVQSATRALYHIVLARELLKIPPSVAGDVIECGTFKGASAASLSLICRLVGRKLWVCDSFAGLPVAEAEIVRNYPHLKVYGNYRQGMYSGALLEVRENIRKHGDIERCEFVQGLFAESLGGIPSKFAFAFVDVDLTSSMQDCIRHIWPKLVDEGFFYTDDSCDMEVVRVWFDETWWRSQLGQGAPGYVGSGCGLPLSVNNSSLGYVQKIANVQKSYEKASFL